MEWIYDDGGRSKYFKAEHVGDCVTRAITIATGKDYKEVYDEINNRGNLETSRQLKKHRGNKKSTARNGVFKETYKQYLEQLGWTRHTTCAFGKGVQCHLTEHELPKGTIIVEISKHLVCVKDSVIHDTYNSSIKQYYDFDGNLVTNDKRAVYAYWTKEEKKPEHTMTFTDEQLHLVKMSLMAYSGSCDQRGYKERAKKLDALLEEIEKNMEVK